MEITKDIHLIPKVRGANAYLLQAETGITIVDTGMPGNAPRILSYVESIGCHRSDIKIIALTHPDIDHAGSAAKLKEATQAIVAIHEADAPGLSHEKALKTARHSRNRLLLRALGAVMRFQRIDPDLLLKDLDIIDSLTVIHTPGHSEGSICFYLPNLALFVGDALVTHANRKLSLPSKSLSVDIGLAKESAIRISQLEFTILLPGHGPPIEQNAAGVTRAFVTRF